MPSPAATDKQATQSPSPAAKPAPELTPPVSKAKQLVGQTEGYEAQAALLAPPSAPMKVPGATDRKADAKTEGAADAKPATEEGAAAGPEKLSPLREAVLEQFRLLDGKGVGDAEFEAICGKSWWEKRKLEEKAAKKYNEEEWPKLVTDWDAQCKADPTYAKTHPKPPKKDDSVFTTCIATQGKILEAAMRATDLHVKGPDVFAFATMGRLEASARGAWTEMKPGKAERPQKGDVLVLEMRGAPDKVQKDIDAESSPYAMNAVNQASLERQLAQARLGSQSATAAIAKAAEAKIPQLEAKLAALKAAHEKKLADLQVKLDEARKQTAAKAGTEKAVKGGRMGGLDFSHVGMFNGLRKEVDAGGKETGREIWTTFDGGQNVPGKVDAQGAKSCTRIYDPSTNEIVSASAKNGALTQDGKMRWLGGFANIDALVDPAAAKKGA